MPTVEFVTLSWAFMITFFGVLQWRNVVHLRHSNTGILEHLESMTRSLQRETTALHVAYDETIAGFARALELRDIETAGHSERVTDLTLKLGKACGLDNGELEQLKRGALLHDLGKIGVPDAVLLKPGRLDDSELRIMRRHPRQAYDLLYPIAFLRPCLDVPYCHHEKWDGTGYPRGLRGQEIPLAARIFSVVDVYDALTHARPYRAAWKKERALEHIHLERNKTFDAEVADKFIDLVESRNG